MSTNQQQSSVDGSLFWNRELSERQDLSALPIQSQARLVSVSDPNDDACSALNKAKKLPDGVKLLHIGNKYEDFNIDELIEQQANVLFVSPGDVRSLVSRLLKEIPSIEWVHCRSAGIDFVTSTELCAFKGRVTNAKGQFSSTLAEYTMMACSYFAKDLPRLLKNKAAKNWDKYDVLELRDSTMGIIGYGDIGQACARLAKAYGMKVIAIRRNQRADSLCDTVYPVSELNRLFSESDYVVCALPLTEDTHCMIGKEQFDSIQKPSTVFINVGRGPVVDEEAMIEALKNGKLRGAGLDVFVEEPLALDSPLWNLDNVLLSPHNMDKTARFMHEATEFFVDEQLPRFVRQQPLLNPVDPSSGY